MTGFLMRDLARAIATSPQARAWTAGTLLLSAICAGAVGLLSLAGSDGSEGRLLVLFKPEVASEQIKTLYRQIRKWETVSEVSYITRENPERLHDGLAEELVPGGYLRVTVRQLSELAELENALRELPGIAAVQSYKRGALRNALSSVGEARTVLWIVVLAGLLIVSVAAIAALQALAHAWAGELEILYLSGVSARSVRGAFFALSLGMGAVAALLAIALMLLVRSLEAMHLWLPELWYAGGTRHATLWVIGFSLASHGLAGLLGVLTIRTKL